MTIDPKVLKTSLRLGASALVLAFGLAACNKPATEGGETPAATDSETTTEAPADTGTSMDSGAPAAEGGEVAPAPEGGEMAPAPEGEAPAPEGGSTPQ